MEPGQRLFGTHQCNGLEKCDSYCCNHFLLFNFTFCIMRRSTPCQYSKKCLSMPPKVQDRVYFSLVSFSTRMHSRRDMRGNERRGALVSLSPRSRSRQVKRGNEGRGALKPIHEESSRRNKNKYEANLSDQILILRPIRNTVIAMTWPEIVHTLFP